MKQTTLKANNIKFNTGQDSTIKEEISKQNKGLLLPCAAAFKIAEKLNIPVGNVGKTADRMHYKFIDCQLGLFGFRPAKKHKLTKPALKTPLNNSILKTAICNSLVNGRLPCKKVFYIALELNVHKLKIIDECTAMEIKISDCQLGAF